MDFWEVIGTVVVSALGTGGLATGFFRSREAGYKAAAAQARAEAAAATAGPKNTAEQNKQLLMMWTRIGALENKLEAKDAQIDSLQEQVLQLQVERNQLRDDLEDARREALGLKAEVAQLRAQVEGVN